MDFSYLGGLATRMLEGGSPQQPTRAVSTGDDETPKEPTDIANNLIQKINNLPPGYYILTNVDGVLDVRLEGSFIKTTKVLYGTISKRVKRYWKRFCSRSASLSILLVGQKGGGKTLEGEVLSNVAITNNIPVIKIVGFTANEKLLNIIYGLNNVVLFLDEFKKHFPPRIQEKLLSFLTDRSKKMLCIITENDINHINFFIKDRPERSFYRREFKKLDIEFIDDYLKDFPVTDYVIDKFSIDGQIIDNKDFNYKEHYPVANYNRGEELILEHKVTKEQYVFTKVNYIEEHSNDEKILLVSKNIKGVNAGVILKRDDTFEKSIYESYRRALTFSVDHITSIVDEHYLFPNDTIDEMIEIVNIDALKAKVMLTIRAVDKMIRESGSSNVDYEPMDIILDKCDEIPLGNFNKGYGFRVVVTERPKEEENKEAPQPTPPNGQQHPMMFQPNGRNRPEEFTAYFNKSDLINEDGKIKQLIAKNYRITLEELVVNY